MIDGAARSESVVIDPSYGWRVDDIDGARIHYRGDNAPVYAALRAFLKGGPSEAVAVLQDAIGHFAGIIEFDMCRFAFVDHCRSIPVFFTDDGRVGNGAEMLRRISRLERIDPDAALEVAMSGYVSGPRTLYHSLRQIPSGHCLSIKKTTPATLIRYYAFLPDQSTNVQRNLINELNDTIDLAIERTIAAADGAAIWVALSGGLDSRLILAKLAQVGHERLFSFCYGPTYSDEARLSRQVAKRLGVPWHFVPTRRSDMKRFFRSDERTEFWRFSSGLCSVPQFQDFVPLQYLMERGAITPEDFVINGATGDFISGGHIPLSLCEGSASIQTLLDEIIAKHYSLWQSLKTPTNLSLLETRIKSELGLLEHDNLSPPELASYYELQEFTERQAKYIVNGQRVYDFLGLNWRLPLWDQALVRFWQNVPLKQKVGQSLYRDYLQQWDYKGVFTELPNAISSWPGASVMILPFLRMIRLACGYRARDWVLRRALYFGLYGPLYAPYRFLDFVRHADDLRSPVSLFAFTWLREHRAPVDISFGS